MNKVFAFLGAGFLIAGCFFPVISVPDRTFTFFDPLPVAIPDIPENAMQYAGILMISIAAISIVFTLAGKTKWLWLSAIAAGSILISLYWGFHSKLDEMKMQADQQVNNLFGGMFKGITDSLFQTVELRGAGWYTIGIGIALLITSSFLKSNANT